MTEATMRSDMPVSVVQTWGEDKTIAQAARVSTLGLDNDRGKFVGLVRALWREGHMSPFMHVGMTLAIECPLFIRSQIVTHQSLARSEFSMRYSEAKPEFWVPAEERPLVQVGKALDYQREPGTEAQADVTRKHLERAAESAWDRYRHLSESVGIAKEVARAVLPQSTYTTLWMSGSLRSWLHFLDWRTDPHAQWEIQDVAMQVMEHLQEAFPVAYQAWADDRRGYEGHRLTAVDGGKS